MDCRPHNAAEKTTPHTSQVRPVGRQLDQFKDVKEKMVLLATKIRIQPTVVIRFREEDGRPQTPTRKR